jgi:hypothetical protein
MAGTNWIALVGIAVAAIVALCIAFMQRKQMRQIELHRADPTITLHPPLHPITHFLKTYWFFGWCLAWAGFDVFTLVRHLRETTPITRGAVVGIVIDILGVIFMFTIGAGIYMSQRAFGITERTIEILEMMTEGHKRTASTLQEMAQKISQLEKRGT